MLNTLFLTWYINLPNNALSGVCLYVCMRACVCVHVHVCMADIIHKQSESRAKEGTVFIYYYLPRVYHDVSTWYKGEGALLYFQ